MKKGKGKQKKKVKVLYKRMDYECMNPTIVPRYQLHWFLLLLTKTKLKMVGQSKILRCFSIPKFRPLTIPKFEKNPKFEKSSTHTIAPSPSYLETETKAKNLLNRRPIPPTYEFNQILHSVAKNKDFNSALKIGQKFL